MVVLAPHEIRIYLRIQGERDYTLAVARPFVGRTVAQAVAILNSVGHEGLAPLVSCTVEPYYVNSERVEENSDRVLDFGDNLKVDYLLGP